jgi:hypothetical protein
LYQACVAKAIRQHQLAGVAQQHKVAGAPQQQPGRPTGIRARIETWLTARHIYQARHEVDEGGQFA